MTLTKPYEATFQVGDGETKDFPFFFDEVSENFIRVIIKRADGSIYYPTFSVDMELLRVVFGEDEITPTPDDVICIYRDTPAIQDTQFNTLQGYNAKALENILSKIVAMIQEMKANGFSTQILQGEPWSLDLIKPADDGASVQIDYQARVLKKGLYFKMSDGNLLASANGVDFVQMPKSAEVKEFRHRVDNDGNMHFEYRVDKGWIGLRGTVETYDKSYIDNEFVRVNTAIKGNSDAIQKTRDDYIEADGEIHQILNNHAENLTTLHNDVDDLGDQVAEIESKIPESASATNQLATKADLKDIDLDGYVKKSGDTITGILTIQDEEDNDLSTPPVGGLSFKSNASPAGFTNRMRQVGNGFIAIEYLLNGKQYSNLVFGDQEIYIANTKNGTGNPVSLGTSGNPWDNVYAKKLNNGADVAIPTEGGTLARLEDVANKQDKLTAGDNIIISGNIISATGAGGGAGFDIVVVQELPATGQKGIIYLLAKDGAAPDVYDEYVWITATQTFELIGTTQVDLTGYVQNTDYATETTGGVIKTARTSFGVAVDGSGFLYASTKTKEQYDTALTNMFIAKGTLENIKEDLVARAIENAVNTQNLTAGSAKFDTAPTTDDNTTYANALDTSLVRKAQVATAIADAVANIDALPDQTGNAGKVLTTDGTTASWQEPAGGTKVIFREWE